MTIDWQAFWLTLQLAVAVSAILLVLGIPLAYWIAFSRFRWRFLVEAIVATADRAAAHGAGILCAGGAGAA